MEVEAAKMIGAGIAAIALGGAGVGIGTIFGNYLAGALAQSSRRRQASAAPCSSALPSPKPRASSALPLPCSFCSADTGQLRLSDRRCMVRRRSNVFIGPAHAAA